MALDAVKQRQDPPPLPKEKKAGGVIEETVSVRRLLTETTPWGRLPGDDGEEDRDIAFSPRGRYAAVSLQDGEVMVWDLSPMPHAVLYLEVPPPLSEEQQGAGAGSVVLRVGGRVGWMHQRGHEATGRPLPLDCTLPLSNQTRQLTIE